MPKFFPWKSQEVIAPKTINLRIVHSKHVIIFYKNSQIKQTIVDVWLPNLTDALGVFDTKLRTNNIYNRELEEALFIQPKYLTVIENKNGRLRFMS